MTLGQKSQLYIWCDTQDPDMVSVGSCWILSGKTHWVSFGTLHIDGISEVFGQEVSAAVQEMDDCKPLPIDSRAWIPEKPLV